MDRYQNGKIYKIVSSQTDKVYYGSTCLPLYKRMYAHKNDYKKYQVEKQHYKTSYEVIKCPECQIILVEEFPCDNKMQLERRERHYIESNECVNKNIPGRTKKEYYQDNREYYVKKGKQYPFNSFY